MRPAEWQAHVDAYLKREARARSWECRLHGLRRKNGAALTDDDFLPDELKSVNPRDPEAVFAAFGEAFAQVDGPPPGAELSARHDSFPVDHPPASSCFS